MTSERGLQRVGLVVVLPVGPSCDIEFVADTIASVAHYAGPSHAVILVDDSGKGIGIAVQARLPGIVVLSTPGGWGRGGGLYRTIALGMSHAWTHYDFEVLMKMDTDALFIGPEPERDAIEHFRLHPELGIIGSYRIDCNGEPRDFAPPRRRIARDLGLASLLRHPFSRWKGWRFLRSTIRRAARDGYEPAEHCQGGAYFVSRECVRRLAEHDLLSRHEIHWTDIGEDQLFGLFMVATGLRHGDFATGTFPIGVRWRGLPCSPEELLARRKKVTHSTRFWGEMKEGEIREFFRRRRQASHAPAEPSGPDL